MTAYLNPVRRFWRLLNPFRKQIRLIYLYAFLNGIVNLSLPIGIQAIINFIQGGEMTSSWMILVAFVLVGIALTGTFQVLQLRVVENIQQDIFARSAIEFAYRIPKIKLLAIDRTHTPELVNRFFDTLTIQKGLPKILIDFSLASFQVVFGLLLLAVYSSYFIILGVLLAFILWLIFRISGKQGLDTSLKESKFKYKMAFWLEEIARTNKTFKVAAGSQFHLEKTDSIAVDYIQSREKHFQVLVNQFKFFIALKVLIVAALLVLGSVLVFQEQMNIGQFVASEIIIILIIASIEKLIRIIDVIYDVLTALEKIGFVTDLPMDEQGRAILVDTSNGIQLEAEDLEFSYPDMRQKLMKHLSFQIPANANVILTGDSGSGKSTFLRLVAGIYDHDDGELLLNNIPINNYNKENLFNNIGFYFPTNQLFEGTILENISLKRDIADEKIYNIINVLGLKSFLAHQTKGLHSLIDPGGRRLPRSIIQKILIARALVHEPRLLLMEDPLIHISEEEKKHIIDYIMNKERPWTSIIVADYPYWKNNATQLLNLEE